MPLRHTDVFYDPTTIPDRGINPYLSQVKDQSLSNGRRIIFTGDSLEGAAKDWRQQLDLNQHRPLVLEIGCYKGSTLSFFAQHHPATFWLGADITFKRIALTGKRIIEGELENAAVLFSRLDPNALKRLFRPGELDGVMVFFPDPWTKTSQKHNRLINRDFVLSLKHTLRPGGFVWFKTDQQEYFTFASKLFAEFGLEKLEETPQMWSEPQHNTAFEARFRQQGLPIYETYLLNHV